MPQTKVQSPTGEIITVEHPMGASEDQIIEYAKSNATPSVAADVGQSIAAAPRKVAEGLVGLPGMAQEGVRAGMDWLTGTTREDMPSLLPTPQDIQGQTSKVLGPSYQPQTTPGKYAGAATEGITGAMLGPGGIAAKIGVGLGSGLGSEAARSQAQGTPYELPASLAGGLVGGIGAMGIGKGVEAARNAISAKSAGQHIGNILGTEPVKGGAVRRVAGSLADDQVTVPGAIAKQGELGNEAMIMDLGRQLQGRAEQMALHSGKAQNTVLDAVEGRTGQFGSGAAQRIRQTLDAEMGPAYDMVQLKGHIHDLVEQHATPAYNNVMAKYTGIQVPPEVSARPAVASAMKQAEGIAANYGDKVSSSVPDLRYWDYVKKAMDHRINGMMRSGMDDLSSVQKADLGGLINAKQSLVQHLDTVTNGEYAAARKIASTKPELDEAADFGRAIVRSKLLPEEIKAHFDDLSVPAQTMVRVAYRRELEHELSNVRNSGGKGRSLLNTDNGLQKIEDIFGPQVAKSIEHRIAAEDIFQNSTDTVARNSRTAVRQELAKDTASPSPGDYHTTLTGIVGAPIKSGLAYALEHGMANTRGGISDILTAGGPQMTPIVEALLNYNAKKAAHASTPAGTQAKALIRALIGEQAAR